MSRNKSKKGNIIVTAGPTWVPIDKVRVITNIFSGKLGYLIARKAAKKGLKVILFLGPGRVCTSKKQYKNLEIIRYKYYNELFDLLKKAVSSKKYGTLIHSAAIADYTPRPVNAKIKSGKLNLIIKLKPTIKIVDQVKKWDPNIFLVKFKLETDISKDKLINVAYNSMLKSNADLMVANEFSKISSKYHQAYIINPEKKVETIIGKENIAKKLLDRIKI